MLRIIPFAHLSIEQFIRKDAIVVDMTCGNGFDTKFLTTLPVKKIYSFDVQKEALEKAQTLIDDPRITWIHDSHVNVKKYVEVFDVAVFNLGYLPGGDQSITTTGSTTLAAIRTLADIARRPALIVLVVYPGHPEGRIERDQLLDYIQTLDEGFIVSKYEMMNKVDAPFVLTIELKNKWTC